MAKNLKSGVVNLLIALVAVAGFGGVHAASAAQRSAGFASGPECKPGNGLQTEEECACAAALKANSIPALEAFLRKYPLGHGPSACGALALNALSNFSGGGGGGGISGGGGGQYGR
jgi:hypothetical protein